MHGVPRGSLKEKKAKAKAAAAASGPPPDGDAVLRELARLLRLDPLIDEVAFVPSSRPEDLGLDAGACAATELPRSFVLVEHKLGIAAASVPALYTAADRVFKAARRAPGQAGAEVQGEAADMAVASLGVVIVNGLHESAWNERKRLVLSGALRCEQELRLIGAVLSKHPKSLPAWAHRRWVLRQGALPPAPPAQPRPGGAGGGEEAVWEWFSRERAVCERAAELRPHNYASWNHQRWAASFLPLPLVLRELERSERYIRYHVADHCAMHYRQALLARLLPPPPALSPAQPNAWKEGRGGAGGEASANPAAGAGAEEGVEEAGAEGESVWRKELDSNAELATRFPGRESLWCHRRFLAQRWWGRRVGGGGGGGDSWAWLRGELEWARGVCGPPAGDGDGDGDEDQAKLSAAYRLWVVHAVQRSPRHGGGAGAWLTEERAHAAAALHDAWGCTAALARGLEGPA